MGFGFQITEFLKLHLIIFTCFVVIRRHTEKIHYIFITIQINFIFNKIKRNLFKSIIKNNINLIFIRLIVYNGFKLKQMFLKRKGERHVLL